MPSAWDWFTGAGKAKKQARETAAQNERSIQGGRSSELGYYGGARDAARDYMQPYEATGRGANALYSNALGLGGEEGRGAAMGAYGQGMSPYLEGDMDAATKAIARRSAAQGQFGSGLNALAQQRATREMGSQDYNNWLARLQGMSGQGQAAAGAMVGNEWQYGSAAGNAERAATQGMVGNQTQLGNALSAANISPMQFMMQNAEMAIRAMSGGKGGGGGGSAAPSAGGSNYFSPQQMNSMNGYF